MRPTPEKIPSGQEPVVSKGASGAFANSLASPNALPIQRPSALVADDDPLARTLLVRLMSSWGYDVVAVSDGDQAIQALEQENGPQLAVLDRMMDGADGIEVCQRVRSLRNSRYVYIILVTSRNLQADRVEGLSAGADDYLTKPFDPLELRARLETGSRICLQRALRDSEMRFQEAIGCSGVGMAMVGSDGNWTQVNQAFVDFFGYEKEELNTLTFRQLTHPKDLAQSEDMFWRLVNGEMKNFQIEKRYLHKKGHTIWGLLTLSLVKTHSGGPAAQMVAQIQDISKSKAAEQALLESEALFRAIAENADELIAVTDPRGTVLYTSPAYKKHLGYETGD
jgi:PAS domain S-box-containing protein